MQSPLGQEGLPTNCQGDVCNLSTARLTGPRAPPQEHPEFWQSRCFLGHNLCPPRPSSPPHTTLVQSLILHKDGGKQKLL